MYAKINLKSGRLANLSLKNVWSLSIKFKFLNLLPKTQGKPCAICFIDFKVLLFKSTL